ncbi:DoxX family protein [Actinocorallia sp. B10E7]|uniref:DoxX family protein n=1 Tax=Actinocorallia sp. B10E7 TaxID=3153558 RepID=UPI00325D2C16
MRTRPAYDAIALFARCAVGVVFLVHGWQKVENGVNATSAAFDLTGVPLAKAAAVYSTFVELLGGVALIAGLGLPLVGALLFLNMAGAFAFVHYDRGLTGPEGSELVLVLAAASLLFAAGAGGRLTVDNALSVHRRRTAELAADFPPPPETEDIPGSDRHPASPSTAPDTGPDGVAAPEPPGSGSPKPPGSGDVPVAGPAPGDVPVAGARGRKAK